MYPKTFSKCALLFSGPKSLFSSVYGPTFSLAVSSNNFVFKFFAVFSPTHTATEIAIHLSPADPKAEPIRASVVLFTSASGITTI